ncbi:hypothetical protein Acsp01_02290 [Actinoplanes sp. NBRC 101535]|nr:hypothetical protein Acsp01_02290 [Actinoplanes sp. NBRC 101535]
MGTVGSSVLRRVLAVLLVLLVVVLIAGRWQYEGSLVTIMLTAITGLLILGGAAAVLLAAALLRAYWLAGAALVLCAVQVLWLAGSYLRAGEQPVPAGATTIRILSANLLLDNTRIAEQIGVFRESGADLLSLQEVTPEHLAVLMDGGLPSVYPYSVADPLPGFHGSAIFSKRPLADARAFDVSGFPMTTATVTVAGTAVRVVDVHVVAPLSVESVDRWRNQLADLAGMRPDGANRAAVLIGDYNATPDHAALQAMTAAGWRDAATEAGNGFALTYPAKGFPGTPLLRIDHAMVSEPLTVVSARTRDNPGSDHRMLDVVLSVPTAS